MQKTTDWLAGEAYLRDKAPELLPFINKYGHCTLEPDGLERYFEVLLTGIAAQQLPPESSGKIMNQLWCWTVPLILLLLRICQTHRLLSC